MAEIVFQIDHQIIQRVDQFRVVSDSRNYLYAKFEFLTDEWTGTLPTAVFQNANDSYEVILDQGNTCLVPWEVLERSAGNFTVTVFAGDLITANSAPVRVYKSAYASEMQPDPTPSVYEQIVERLDDIENLTVTAETLPEGSSATAEYDDGHLTLGIPKGDTGEQGPQGIQGIQGPKGDKGDKGDAGEQGPKGDTGEQGPKGDKGDRGNTGPQGVRGERGYTGPKGDTGIQGPKGDKGDTGIQGPKGDKGDTGEQGPKGDTGEVSQAELDAVKSDLSEKASVITNTASGSIAHFEDGSDANAKSVIAHIESVQEGSGDPSPDNIRPISGFTGMNITRTGKNLFPGVASRTSSGVTFTPNADGSATVNGTATGSSSSFSTAVNFHLKPGTYKKSGLVNGVGTYIQRVVDSQTWQVLSGGGASSTQFIVTEEDCKYRLIIRLSVYSGTTCNNVVYYPYIYLDSETDTIWVSPKQENISIIFPSEAGTVYGGYVDPVKGKLVVDRVIYDLSELNFGSAPSVTYGWWVCDTMKTTIVPPATSSVVVDAITEKYATKTYSAMINDVSLVGMAVVGANSDIGGQIVVRTGSSDSPSGNAVFKLATPITYDITPTQIATLLGVNNVWNDTNGDTDVEYRSDTKLFIEQLTKSTEDDMVANSAIASGKFFMIGNRLFISTSTIASGDTINPGTNCTELSLADALNSL